MNLPLRRRADRWAVGAIGMSALIGGYVRLTESYVTPVSDAKSYVTAASGIALHPVLDAETSWSIGHMAMRGVTYPLLLAALLTLGGSLAAVVWFQSLVLVPATVGLLFLTGRRAFSPAVGLVAAWGFALWAPAQVYTSLLMQETWLSFLIALLLYLLSRCVTGGGRWTHLAMGLLLGVLAITHSAFQLVGLLTVLALSVHRWIFKDQSQRRTAWALLGLLAVLLPSLVVRSAFDLPQQGEGARGYGGGGGWTFWIGSNPALGFHQPVDGYKFSELTGEGEFTEVLRQIRSGELATDPNLTRIILAKAQSPDLVHEKLTDADFYRAGIQNLLSDPGAWPRKLAYGWNKLVGVPTGLTYYRSAPSDATLGAPWQFLSYALFTCGLAGMILTGLRHRSRLILGVPFVVQLAVLLAAFPESRHVIPLWGSLFLFAGVTLPYVRQALAALVSTQRDARPAMALAAIATGTLLLTTGVAHAAPQRSSRTGELPQTLAQAVFDRDTLRRVVLGVTELPEEPEDLLPWRTAFGAPVLKHAQEVRQSDVPLRFGLHSTLTEYAAVDPADCGFIIHGGHGSWIEGGGQEVAELALERGCRVVAIDMPEQGVNAGQLATLPTGDRLQLRQPDGLHNAFAVLDSPSRTALDLFVVPVIAAVDHLTRTGDSQQVTMAGLSGGGWTTSLAAAVDPRISRSMAVAGSTTVDTGQPCGLDYEQCLSRLYSQIPMQTIYVLAASGPGRAHAQILNYYDPCCHAYESGQSWVPQVQASVAAIGDGGQYTFVADRTQPGTHTYPPAAMQQLDAWFENDAGHLETLGL